MDGNFVVSETVEEGDPNDPEGTNVTVIENTYPYTSEFRLAGKWVKVLGYNPFQYSDTAIPGKYLSISHAKPLQFTLQTEGYDMLYVHSNFGKSVSEAFSALDNNYITPTNILWTIKIVSNPLEDLFRQLQYGRESVVFHTYTGRDRNLFHG